MAPLEQKEQKEQEPPSSLCGLLEGEERPANEVLIKSRPSHISHRLITQTDGFTDF